MLFLVLLLGLDLFPMAASKLNTEEAYVTVARCRINCLKQFLAPGRQNNDNACRNTNNHRTSYSRECAECWQLCLTFQTSSLYHVACGNNSPACTEPCQAACQFVQNTTAVKPATAEWKFPENASVITDQVEMQITWRPPVMVSAQGQVTPKNQPIVYVLLSRNSNRPSDGWAVLNMIISSSIRIDIDAVPLTPEFLLLAVSEEGLIAQSRFKTLTSPGDIPDPSGAELRKLKDWPEATYYSQTVRNISAQLTFNKTLVRRAAGSHWSQSVEVRFRVPELLNEHSVHFFKLNWFLVTCREAYNFVPACALPRDNTAATVYARGKEEVSYVMQDLKFNSIYLLLVQVSEDFRVRAELVFKTEPCLKPDLLQLTRCLDDVKEAELPLVPIVHTLQPVFEPEVLRLQVNVTSMTYQPTSDRVLVNVTWLPLLNRSSESYNVTTFMEGRSLLVSRHVTSHPYISLSLEPHTQYYVKVEAGFRTQPGPDSQPPVFDEILVNTSDVSLAVYQGLEAIRLPSDSLPPDDMDQVDGIIIGVTCFIIILVLVGLFVVLYKKRKSFRGIIVTKATVAKSNSYKSSVGGSVRK